MLNSFRKLSIHNLGGPIRSFVFFALFYLYLWLVVDLRLIYHGAGVITNFPAFYRGWAFLREFISYPGGPVEYLSAFLSQLFYIGWLGALVVTLQAWLICLCTGYFLKAVNAPRLRWVRFIPPILLLIIYNQYAYHFVTTMALLAALAFVCLYVRIRPRNKLPNLVAFLVLSVVLYYIIAGAYLFFAVLCAIYELLFKRQWQMGMVCLLSALLIPYVVGVLIFNVSIINAFSDLLPFSWKILSFGFRKRMITTVHILYLLLPLTAFVLGLLSSLVPRLSSLVHKPRWVYGSEPHVVHGPRPSSLRWIIESLVLFAIAGASVFFSYDNKSKTLFAVDYYAHHKMWPQVLATAHRYPGKNFYVVHSANLALYHTGRLGYDMFSYPQHINTLLLTDKDYINVYWQKFDACLELGFINRAEHELTVSLDQFGEHPLILKRLALVNMVKADSGTARTYLGALSKTLFDADWAESYLHKLESDPNLSTEQDIQHLRGVMMESNYGYTSLGGEKILLDLLSKNRQNRMAFEYLMASYLVTGQLEKLVENLNRLDDFDYPQIPRLYEEAILVYTYLTKEAVDLHGREVSRQSRQRFEDFNQVFFGRYWRNKQAALDELAKNYGDSYFFYNIYGFSGTKK